MKIGFIDYYLDEWHANNYPELIKKASGGAHEVVCAYAHVEPPAQMSLRSNAQWSADYGIPLVDTIEEVIAQSDCLIVLSPDNPEMHELLCELPLASGKRTYIDKTFAPDKKTAQAMFALGEQYGTPCYSSSALRYAEEYQPFLDKQVKTMSMWGSGDVDTYSIHQLEPLMMLMKGKVSRVMAKLQDSWTNVTLEWEDGRTANILCSGKDDIPFVSAICTEEGTQMVQVKSAFFDVFIKSLVHFFRTGEVPVTHEETISIMAVREAVMQAAAQPGVWVELN
jgi:predicted dehydrogenase